MRCAPSELSDWRVAAFFRPNADAWGRKFWLLPGINVKRWLLLSTLGVVMGLLGAMGAVGGSAGALAGTRFTGCWTAFCVSISPRLKVCRWHAGLSGWHLSPSGARSGGGVLRRAWRTLAGILQPRVSGRVWDVLSRYALMAHGKRVVVIGGGTGLSTMLRGIKRYTVNIVAVVTVTDDGGSSGRLRAELGILPPGRHPQTA
jgi:hypothetical protein